MEDGMQTVTPGASHLEVTPIAYGTWQFGGDWESVDEQASVAGLVREGLTRHVGISNYTTDQITEFAAVLPAATVQPPYHLFRRDIEAGLLPYAQARHIGVLPTGRWPTGCSAAPSPKPPRSVAMTGGRTARPSPGPGSGAISKSSRRWAASPPTAAPPSPSSRWPGCWPTRPSRSPSSARAPRPTSRKASAPSTSTLSQGDLAEIDSIMTAAVPLGGPSPEGMI
jgi:hypothetical protein